MRVVVLGANGQLGRDLAPRLAGEVLAWTRADLDLGDPTSIAPALAAARPDVVVNCAAYNLVDKAEAEPDAAFRVNAWGVRELAKACDALGARLVQFSTDYVFGLDDTRTAPLAATDPPGPVSAYGMSKLAGEYAVRTFARRHLIVRTCGLYGAWGVGGKGGNFVETMLRLAGQGKPLRVVNDQRCTPTATADLADATVKLIEGGATGVVHATNAGDCTWHEFAAEIFKQGGIAADLTPIASAEFAAPARRPRYSVLASSGEGPTSVRMRPWREALADYLERRKQRPA